MLASGRGQTASVGPERSPGFSTLTWGLHRVQEAGSEPRLVSGWPLGATWHGLPRLGGWVGIEKVAKHHITDVGDAPLGRGPHRCRPSVARETRLLPGLRSEEKAAFLAQGQGGLGGLSGWGAGCCHGGRQPKASRIGAGLWLLGTWVEPQVAVPWEGVRPRRGGAAGREGASWYHVRPGSPSCQLLRRHRLAGLRCSRWFGGRAPGSGVEGAGAGLRSRRPGLRPPQEVAQARGRQGGDTGTWGRAGRWPGWAPR